MAIYIVYVYEWIGARRTIMMIPDLLRAAQPIIYIVNGARPPS